MPNLSVTLKDHDLGFLRLLSEGWGIELEAQEVKPAIAEIVQSMCNRPLVNEIIEALPEEARFALQALLKNDGLLPWQQFSRQFGELRSMGAARRDRERPDINPLSPSEMLWYRGLIGRSFLNLPPEPQEYAYIPDELQDFLKPVGSSVPIPFGHPASPVECAHLIPTSSRILDHACTMLAAYRADHELGSSAAENWHTPLKTLACILDSAGLMDTHGTPQPEAIRVFLESSRPEALSLLVRSWMQAGSDIFNELRLLPHLVFEGEWHNDALRTRQVLLELLKYLPQDIWWSLESFIEAVKDQRPDFQRPAGDYDSWFIRHRETDQYLRGFSSWNMVDGAVIRYMITGPLHWLGILDLAAPVEGEEVCAFRPSSWAKALWVGSPPESIPEETDIPILTSDGQLHISALVPRTLRYQLARFCTWNGEDQEMYHYKITPASLTKAKEKDLRMTQLIRLLEHSLDTPIPPNLVTSLQRWEETGVQVRIESIRTLQVSSPEILKALQQTRADRFLGNKLNPTTIIVKTEGEEVIRRALADLGYLVERL
jgi:hypothetical protein